MLSLSLTSMHINTGKVKGLSKQAFRYVGIYNIKCPCMYQMLAPNLVPSENFRVDSDISSRSAIKT